MRGLAYVSPFLLAIGALIGGSVHASVYAQEPPTATPPVLQSPAAPTNFEFEGSDLVWDDNSDNEEGFRIYKTVGGAAPEVVVTLAAGVTATPIPAVGIGEACDGTTFTVVAFNATGESVPSEGVDIPQPLCDPGPLLPAAPTNFELEFGPPGNTLIGITWVDTSDNEDGFRLYWFLDGGKPQLLATFPANTSQAPHIVDIRCGENLYTLVAFNEAGESAPTIGPQLAPICEPIISPPDGGSGPVGHPTANRWLLALAGVGLALVIVGAGSISVSIRR